MSRKKLVVFPSQKQIDYIYSLNLDCEVYIVLHKNDVVTIEKNHRVVILDEEIKSLESDLGTNVDVLCCHEESLYWVKNFGCPNWNYQFSTKIFDLFEKNNFKEFLSKNDILNAKFEVDSKQVTQFPVIMKPVIGFGSIGVKKINSLLELEEQLNEHNQEKLFSRIKPYKDRYFENVNNTFIFEEFISGNFYRTPFVVVGDTIESVFPIRGKNTTYRENSDFHWTDFEYGEDEKKVAPKLKNILKKLSSLFCLKNGVYVAEFIMSETGNVYLLEFSPRQTSDRIAKMVLLATGIDLEKIAIDMFLFEASIVQLNNCDIRMRIERTDSKLIDKDYVVIDIQEEKSVYGDRILTTYYERKTEHE